MLTRKLWTIGVLALFLAGTFLARPAVVQSAPQPAPQEQKIAELPCAGMDIVFLISQAGSMKVNDVNGMRITAVRNAISMLVDNALYFCPGYKHRLAVLGFGELGANDPTTGYNEQEIAVYIEPQILEVPASGYRQWIDAVNLKKAKIRAEVLNYNAAESRSDVESALNYTYARVLKPWTEEKIEGPRRKAVIMIGDGNLCTVENKCDVTSRGFQEYLQKIQDLVDPRGTKYPYSGFDHEESVHIRYISFTTPQAAGYVFTDNLQIRNFWNKMVTTHGVAQNTAPAVGALPPVDFVLLQGGVETTEEERKYANQDVAARVAEVFGALLGSTLKTWDCTKPIWIEPYRSSVSIFHVFKIRSVDTTQITIKAGNQIIRGGMSTSGGQVEWESTDTIEKYKIPVAAPGKYEVIVQGGDACKDIVIQVGQSSVNANLLVPAKDAEFMEVDKDPFYDLNNPVRFRFELRQPRLDGSTEPLKEIAGYPLSLSLSITNPKTGAVVPYALTRVDDAKAIYQADKPLTFREPGVYKWELIGLTNDPREVDPAKPNEKTKTQIEVLKTSGTYTVLALERDFDFSVLSPKDSPASDGYALEGADMAPLLVQVQVTNKAGQPLRADLAIAEKEQKPFEAVLVNDKGQVVDTQQLTLSATSPNLYTAQFTGSARDKKRFDYGCYQVKVSLTGNYNSGVYRAAVQAKDPIKVCFYKIEKFTWKIENPVSAKNYELHPQLAWFPPLINVPLQITVSGPGAINSADMPQAGKFLFTGVLKGPNESAYPLTFTPEKVDKGKVSNKFVANWPPEADQEGTYTLTVDVNKDAAVYTWTPENAAVAPITFTRIDPLTCKPWALLALIIAIAIALLIAFLIWNFIVRPRGMITLTNLSTKDSISWVLGRPLAGWWWLNVNRKAALRQFGFSKITAKKVKPSATYSYDGMGQLASRAVYIRFYREGVEDPNSGQFNAGDKIMLDADVEAEYN